MTENERGILMYETTLSAETRQHLRQIGRSDIVIGIPSHRNGRTIGDTVRAVVDGISAYLYDQRVVLMNADGGSSDNTTRHIAEALTPPNVEKLVTLYEGANGKGTAIRSIFEAAAELQAKAVLVVEARAPGITPEWIPSLLTPILRGNDLALACYQRSAYSSALTDNLLYPLLRVFFNVDLREPFANEFALSGPLAADLAGRDVWETDITRFGVNIWVAVQALAEERRVVQVGLGHRGETSGEPGLPLDLRFLHTVGTMFRLLAVHRRIWQAASVPRHVPLVAGGCPDEPLSCQDCAPALLAAFHEGEERYADEWRHVLGPTTWQQVHTLCRQSEGAFEFPAELWARVAMEFAIIYNQGEGDPDKVAEALLPIFYGRAATYVRQASGLSAHQREALVEQVVRAMGTLKPGFIKRWDSFEPWTDDMARYW
jgi:hypothetical protein